ncbi:uncharacterized protein LOC124894066 [Capsicum annuum]|uniref:uncharacterized protein LOC124894066 n=1 Tax=Capsicum annuum TaxID=4072 RepID=UPI001FB174FC|nr:uncharacterized protein LOC124894066 [Capsicum annuum]
MPPRQPCRQCGRYHIGAFRMGTDVCYWCGMPGHVIKDCPRRRRGDIAQPTGSAVASSSSVPPSGRGEQFPIGRGRGIRGAASSSVAPNRTYALGTRQNLEASPDVVIGTLSIFSHKAYALIDPGSTLSYITPLVAGKLGRTPNLLNQPLAVSTPTGESIIARRVYCDCIVTICDRDTLADLIELEMGYICHLIRVRDVEAESPTIKSVPIVNEFIDVFPEELPGLPPEREIDFGIDLLPGTEPISIPPYRMAPAELRKANVVADALSRKTLMGTSDQKGVKQGMAKDLRQLANLGVRLLETPRKDIIVHNATNSSLIREVKEKQCYYPILQCLKEKVSQGIMKDFRLTQDGVLYCQNRLCVPDVNRLRRRIMEEAHHSRYSIHPGSTKMYHDLKGVFWWGGMKKDLAEFVAQCPTCQQVKVEHQKPVNKFYSIWVIVDRLTKSAHFLPVRSDYTAEEYAKLYLKEIVRLHGVPLSIISDRGAQFTAKFWKSFQKSLGTRVNLSTDFHPQTDGQAERTIQTLEDMLRTCALDFKGDPSRITPIEDVQFTEDLTYEEVPVAILDHQVKKLRNKEMASVKVLWRNNQVEEITWEPEEVMISKYPHLFEDKKGPKDTEEEH